MSGLALHNNFSLEYWAELWNTREGQPPGDRAHALPSPLHLQDWRGLGGAKIRWHGMLLARGNTGINGQTSDLGQEGSFLHSCNRGRCQQGIGLCFIFGCQTAVRRTSLTVDAPLKSYCDDYLWVNQPKGYMSWMLHWYSWNHIPSPHLIEEAI